MNYDYLYYEDSRTKATSLWKNYNKRTKTIKVTAWVDEESGDTEEISLPACMAVCDLCEGEGKYTNPSMDFNGLDTSDMDKEEIENYFMGTYDICCKQCNGKRVVPVIDRNAISENDTRLIRHEKYLKEEEEYESMIEAERRYGC